MKQNNKIFPNWAHTKFELRKKEGFGQNYLLKKIQFVNQL